MNKVFASMDSGLSRANLATASAPYGYATDPHYAALLISIINKYKLDQYDVTKLAAPASALAPSTAPAPGLPAQAPVQMGRMS